LLPNENHILIIEDSESKRLSIQEVVFSAFPNHAIRLASSVSSAIDELDRAIPAVIIADMSLPTYDVGSRERGGTPRPLGGLEVFDHLDHLEYEVPVVVVSSYSALGDGPSSIPLTDLAHQLERDYPSLYRGYVFFDSTYTTWAKQLDSLLKSIVLK
jgi:CheY-like chemotaxis protein